MSCGVLAVHNRAQINFGDLTPYLTYGLDSPFKFLLRRPFYKENHTQISGAFTNLLYSCLDQGERFITERNGGG
jgi:hypothetical protein